MAERKLERLGHRQPPEPGLVEMWDNRPLTMPTVIKPDLARLSNPFQLIYVNIRTTDFILCYTQWREEYKIVAAYPVQGPVVCPVTSEIITNSRIWYVPMHTDLKALDEMINGLEDFDVPFGYDEVLLRIHNRPVEYPPLQLFFYQPICDEGEPGWCEASMSRAEANARLIVQELRGSAPPGAASGLSDLPSTPISLERLGARLCRERDISLEEAEEMQDFFNKIDNLLDDDTFDELLEGDSLPEREL